MASSKTKRMNHFTGILCLLVIAAFTVTSVHGSFNTFNPKALINPTTVGAALKIASGEDPKQVMMQTGMQMAANNQVNGVMTSQQPAPNVIPQVPPYQQQSNNQVVSQPPGILYDQTAPQTAQMNQQQQQFNQAPVGPQNSGQVSSNLPPPPPPPYPGQSSIPGYTYPPSPPPPPPAYTGFGNVPPPTPLGYTNVTPGQNQQFNTQPQPQTQYGRVY